MLHACEHDAPPATLLLHPGASMLACCVGVACYEAVVQRGTAHCPRVADNNNSQGAHNNPRGKQLLLIVA